MDYLTLRSKPRILLFPFCFCQNVEYSRLYVSYIAALVLKSEVIDIVESSAKTVQNVFVHYHSDVQIGVNYLVPCTSHSSAK